MANLDEFYNCYQVQITTRNELIPQGATLKYIKDSNFLNMDKKLAANYQKAKPIINKFYQKFIDKTLQEVQIDWQNLALALNKYRQDKTAENKKKLNQEQEKIREAVTKYFEGKAGSAKFQDEQKKIYPKLFSSKLLTDLLPNSGLNTEEQHIIDSFHRFTTYFSGFYENRKNIFTSEEKSTAVGYRIVNDNFPKFLANMETYQILASICPDFLTKAEKILQDEGLLEDYQLKEIFALDFYNEVLNQTGIDFYNQVIGGPADKADKKQGFNELINLTLQQNVEIKEKLQKKSHKLLPLFKQILSDRKQNDFLPDNNFAEDQEVFDAVSKVKQDLAKAKVLPHLVQLFTALPHFDLKRIYIDHKNFTRFSTDLTQNWSILADTIIDTETQAAGGKLKKKDLEQLQRKLRNTDWSLEELQAYDGHYRQKDGTTVQILDYMKVIQQKLNLVEAALQKSLPVNLKTAKEKTALKEQLDALLDLLHIIKVFAVSGDNSLDPEFYSIFDPLYLALEEIIPLYNKVRNYATQKPYSLAKFKLNFNLPTLAKGWDQNKEKTCGAIILMKEGFYYLGIVNANDKPDIAKAVCDSNTNVYRKMVYKLFPKVFLMIPKCSTECKEVKEHFAHHTEPYYLDNDNFNAPLYISKQVYDLNNVLYGKSKKFQKDYLKQTGDNEGYYKALAQWIDFSKEFIRKYKSTAIYDISSLSAASQYKGLDEFYGDLDRICYSITFENLPVTAVEQWVEKGQLYLFKIHNKDFNQGCTGKPNLHTLYWKALFDQQNLSNVVLKLNGEAELFYRPQSKMQIVDHKVGTNLVNKIGRDGRTIPDTCYQNIYRYVNGQLKKGDLKEEDLRYLAQAVVKPVRHTIIKDKRFTEDKFFFHVPILINYQAEANVPRFNEQVQSFLRHNPDINIIGIDRGERNLIYAVVINQKGEILDKQQRSFNIIQSKRSTGKPNAGYNYNEKLQQCGNERDDARKAWTTIGKIKDLKAGYLSQVVREIADMMIKYNAIVVLENLNVGFKRVRGGISEKSVYQKFEKALISKLNYLVFKERGWKEPGGLLKGYQLTDKFSSFENLGSQSGFLFYVPAAYTSKIDPVTGFTNVLNLKNITNKEAKKDFLSRFDSIRYVPEEKAFAIACDLRKFKTHATMFKQQWVLYAKGERIVYQRERNSKTGTYITKKPAEMLGDIFQKFGIDYQKGQDILPQLLTFETNKDNIELFDTVYQAISLTLQMRNSCSAKSEDAKDKGVQKLSAQDYIISPVKGKERDIFITSKDDSILPQDADANGAYHIALKGLYLLKQINATKEGTRAKLTIKNEDWFKFVQNKTYSW